MKKTIFLCILVPVILSSCTFFQPEKKNKKQPTYDLSQQIPIILIHGSGGDENSFVHFTDEFLALPDSSTETLAVTIDTDNELHYQGTLSKKAKHPLISIGYTDNNAPIEEWSTGLKTLLIDLKKNYHFTTVDAVGYSNGGLALTYYAETIKQANNVPALRKIVLLGAPFNDLEPEDNTGDADFNKVANETTELQKYQALKQNLAPDLMVLSIAGDDDSGENTDGIVPLRSALASRFIFPEYVHTYIEKHATKEDASHLNLINNSQIISWVHDFLFDYQPQTDKTKQLVSSK